LVFLIKSPAQISVEYNGNKYEEDEGIIFIENAQSGDYKLNIQGTDLGKYQVIIGQVSQSNDIWDTLDGEIIKTPPSLQIDTEEFYFNNQTATSIFPTTTPIPSSTPTPTTNPTITPLPTITSTSSPIPTITPTITPTPVSTSSLNTTTSNTTNSTNPTASTPEFPVKSNLIAQNWTKSIPKTNKNLVSNSPTPKVNKSKPQVLGTTINKKENQKIFYISLALVIVCVGIYLLIVYIGTDKVKNIILNFHQKLLRLIKDHQKDKLK